MLGEIFNQIMEKTYRLNYSSNNDSNEFLRCLWSILRKNFGKAAWNLLPFKVADKKFVHFGYIDLGKIANTSTNVKCTYSKKGCLNTITFENNDLIDENEFIKLLNSSIDESKNFKNLKKKFICYIEFDNTIQFQETKGNHFTIENNIFSFNIIGYDETDAKTFANSNIRFLSRILSFDNLKFINLKNTGISELRNNREIIITDYETGASSSHIISDELKKLKVSNYISRYIDNFLVRDINYIEPLNYFEKSIIFFAEGLFFEELYNTSLSLDFNSIEYAITSYMSSLELITINDIKSEKCNSCNQDIFSISKRIMKLAKDSQLYNESINKIISQHYVTRSKFIHTGSLIAMHNYIGKSIPLLSFNSESGLIDQRAKMNNLLKNVIKDLILYHQKDNKDFTSHT